jgi:transcriptional regulator with XRE-family HTH domain
MSIRTNRLRLTARGMVGVGCDETKHRLGQVIARRRAAQGMAQRHLAAALDKPPATVSAWERGKVYPDLVSLLAVARVLGATISELLAEAGIEAGPPPSPHQKAGQEVPDAVAEWSRRRAEHVNATRYFLEPLIIAAGSLVTDDPNFTTRAFQVDPQEVLRHFIELAKRNPLASDAEAVGHLRSSIVELIHDAESTRSNQDEPRRDGGEATTAQPRGITGYRLLRRRRPRTP